jgi:hypothetical protein
MGHLLKIKCVDSTMNVAHFSVNKCPIYTHDGGKAKYITNSHETDNGVGDIKATTEGLNISIQLSKCCSIILLDLLRVRASNCQSVEAWKH